jgi:hypothetical protein
MNTPPRQATGPTPGPWRTTPHGGSIHFDGGILAIVAPGPAQQANAELMASAPTLQRENEILKTALVQALKDLARLDESPIRWALRLEYQYLDARLSWEEASAWGLILSQGQFARANPGVAVAVVTA